MPKKTYNEQISELEEVLRNELNNLKALNSDLDNSGRNVIRGIGGLLGVIKESGRHFKSKKFVNAPFDELENIEKTRKDIIANLKTYFDNNKNPNGKNQKKVFESLSNVTKAMGLSDDALNQLQNGLKLSTEIIGSLDNPEYEVWLQEYYEKEIKENYGMRRPDIKECCTLSVEKNSPREVFERMLWLSDHTLRYSHNSDTNLYQETLNRLEKEIEEAPIGTKMEYLKLFNDFYNACELNERESGAFARVMTSFGRGEMGILIYTHHHEIREKNIRFKSDQLKEPAEESNICTIGFCYSKIINDKGKTTPAFEAVKNAMEGFIGLNHEEVKDEYLDAYSKALERVQDTSRILLSSYKKNPSDPVISNRVENIRILKAAVDSGMQIIAERLARQKERQINELENDAKRGAISQSEKFLRIARLHSNITPVRMVPKNAEHSFEPSRLSKLGRALGHWVYSGLNMVIGNTIGRLISNIARPFTQRNKKRPNVDLDTDLIPGSGGDHFAKYDPEQYDDKQPILDDVRRVPMVWEKPIPGDPDLAPTVSFNVSQGKEGDSRTMVTGGTGHAHITLTYSKINPLTGKNQRYSLSVGFFPKGGFDTLNITTAQYLNGMKIPGTLGDDSSNIFSIGKQFTVNNKQINKILLASQSYDKGGYNSITRNCTTFAVDMAKAAGLDVGSVMKEVDFTSETNKEAASLKAKLAFGGTLLGPQFTRLAKRDILKKVGRDDLSYKNIGQKMLNAQDVKRLWSVDFNTRMKGYSPNHVAENIRHEKGSMLHSRQYFGIYDPTLMTEEERFISAGGAVNDELIKLSAVMRNIGKTQDEKTEAAETDSKVVKYCSTMNSALKAALNEISVVKNSRGFKNTEDIDKYYGKADQIISEYIENLNKVYHDTYKDNQELNIPFNHMVSVLEFVQQDVRRGYSVQMQKNETVLADRGNRLQVQALLNGKQNYLADINDELKAFKSGSYSAREVVGMIKVYGSVKKALKAELKYEMMTGGQIPADKSELVKMEKSFEAIHDFANAEKSFFSGREFTKSDYKLAFNDIHEGLEGVRFKKNEADPESIYQSEVYNRMFPGLRKEVNDIISQIKDTGMETEYGKQLSEKLQAEMLKRMESVEGHEILDNIKEAMLPCIAKKYPKPSAMDDAQYLSQLDHKLGVEIKNSMLDSFVVPLVKDSVMLSSLSADKSNKFYNAFENSLYDSKLDLFNDILKDPKNSLANENKQMGNVAEVPHV